MPPQLCVSCGLNAASRPPCSLCCQAHDLCVTTHAERHRLAWNSIWRISEIVDVIVQNLAPKDVVSIARTARLLPESIVSCSRTAFLKIILHHYRVSSGPKIHSNPIPSVSVCISHFSSVMP